MRGELPIEESSWSEDTKVRLGLALGAASTIVFVSWWASGVQSDLNYIKSQISHLSNVDNINARVTLLEEVGSKALRDRIGLIQLEIDSIRRDFDVHRAQQQTVPEGRPLKAP